MCVCVWGGGEQEEECKRIIWCESVRDCVCMHECEQERSMRGLKFVCVCVCVCVCVRARARAHAEAMCESQVHLPEVSGRSLLRF